MMIFGGLRPLIMIVKGYSHSSPFCKGGLRRIYAALQWKPETVFQTTQREYDRCLKASLGEDKDETTKGIPVLPAETHR